MDKSKLSQRKLVICDIDGVIADCSHRLHFIEKKPADWDGFFEACVNDSPIEPMIRFLQALDDEFDILYVTGRPKGVNMHTLLWMARYEVPVEKGSDIYKKKIKKLLKKDKKI